jgi:hypothetical protein
LDILDKSGKWWLGEAVRPSFLPYFKAISENSSYTSSSF